MSDVEVIIPASVHDDAHRVAARDWVIARYRRLHKEWPLTVALHDGQPWCKAAAVNPEAAAATADILVIADADSVVSAPALRAAVIAVAGRHEWAAPASSVRRLDPEPTADLVAGPPDVLPDPRSRGRDHQLLAGGGIVVVRRDLWADADGYDPRFQGWGGEDYSLGCALRALSGQYAHREPGTLWHLWHPPAPSHGGFLSDESSRLSSRYRAAKHDPAAMRQLISERQATWH